MRTLICSALLCAGLMAPPQSLAQQPRPEYEPLQIGPRERLLVIAPHPDDETLGAGGLAQRVLALGGSVRTIIVTAGDGYVEAVQKRTHKQQPEPREFLRYGERRIHEAKSAGQLLGAGRIRLSFFGFPDGGILPLLAAHWAHLNPERSETTRRAAPPYPEAESRGASYSGQDLRRRILAMLREARPTLIAFTDPLDQHPDHRAIGLLALASIGDYMRARSERWPRLFAFVIHYDGWPFDPDGKTETRTERDPKLGFPPNLPRRGQTRSCLMLSDAELALKQAALAEYRTQQSVMAPFLAGFVRRNECFSSNTELDVSDPAHPFGLDLNADDRRSLLKLLPAH